MSHEAWEAVQRIEVYCEKALEVFVGGGDISDLVKITGMLKHLRIVAAEEEVRAILALEVSVEEKLIVVKLNIGGLPCC